MLDARHRLEFDVFGDLAHGRGVAALVLETDDELEDAGLGLAEVLCSSCGHVLLLLTSKLASRDSPKTQCRWSTRYWLYRNFIREMVKNQTDFRIICEKT